jgi:23S rRNA pseudouridine1911/1915/1917 synthase
VPDSRLELTVQAGQAGTRLDRFLAEPLGSRSAAQTLIETGRVEVNGRPRPKRHLLQAGDVVAALTGSPDEDGRRESQPPPAEYAIAYEDQHLMVVDKPPGVVVHPARGHRTGTLSQALAGQSGGGEADRPGIVHRLDRDTSGLLVVARTDAVHRALKALLSSRRLSREYVALVDGHPPARSGTIDAPIGRDRRDRLRVSLETDTPRRALSHFEVRRRLPDSTLLAVRLETGRTHQIRVHLAAIGHPVAGDPLYGTAGRFGLARQFLHAERLAFPHPVTGEPVDVRSELPEDLEAALERAGRRA